MDSFATKTLSCRIYPLEFCLIGQLHDDVTDVILLQLTTPENTITYHNAICCHPKILHKHCFLFLLGPF